ncbi:hypothetical protein RND81_02G173500 [Saponaria officinalis]|uniref:MULE transposase domain-containing protein n=1 Tax=Saponaria officinalis TaxID=3572 RepID=A0AAW1MVD0_SAPOF
MEHPEAVNLFRAYPSLFGIDYTYKTNLCGMPLVELIGVTPVGKNFTIAYALVETETTEGYTWVLEKLRSLLSDDVVPNAIVTDREKGLIAAKPIVFPDTYHLLCTFHIYNAVEARTREAVGDDDQVNVITYGRWAKVVDAGTEQQMLRAWDDLQVRWSRRAPRLIRYIAETWIVHKEKFCRCYTNKVTYFGNRATSRVEVAHVVLKDWLSSSNLSLDSIWTRINALLIGQHVEINKALQDSIGTQFHEHHGPLFSLLSGHVFKRALRLMHAEWTRGVTLGAGLVGDWGCIYRLTHGLMCIYELYELRSQDRRVHLDDIHIF